MEQTLLSIEHLKKSYDDNLILDDINLEVHQGEVIVLVGPSGCGKSTMLRCINALEPIQEGEIKLNGEKIDPKNKNIAELRQKIGMVFQSYELFPHLTVLDNILLAPMKVQKRKKEEAEKEAMALLERVGLAEKAKSYPRQLSGGQKQRVAMARMIASEPDILLLDEPFSALDSYLKWELEQEMRDMLAEVEKPVLFVSHNRDEVYRLCNMVSCIDHGKMEVIEETKEFFHNPKTKTAAVLSGCKNISAVEIVDNSHIKAVDWGITLCVPEIPKDTKAVGIRAHSFYPVDAEPVQDMNILRIEEYRIIEDTFEWNISFRPSKESGWLQWKIAKTEQEDSPGPIPSGLAVDAKDILLLRDNAYE